MRKKNNQIVFTNQIVCAYMYVYLGDMCIYFQRPLDHTFSSLTIPNLPKPRVSHWIFQLYFTSNLQSKGSYFNHAVMGHRVFRAK